MRAAIYARKSTDDSDRNPENRSTARQVERARAYAEAKGWVVDEELVFVDDGISGAEYVNRPGFARLMGSLKQFDVLVMSEASRLGRDMTRNAAYVVDLVENGKRIFYYLTDEEERADTPEQKIIVTLRSYASEVERLKAGQRARDALAKRAERGFNAGGVVYGYDNVRVFGTNGAGEQVASHTDYKVNEREADVLRRIFTMYAAGFGHVTVAKTLNGDPRYATHSQRYFDSERPPSPRKGTGSWAPSSIRAMLYNERYTGVVPFGEHRKVYRRGTKARVRQADEAVLRAARPDLRIIPEELWREVQARLAAVRRTYVRDNDGRVWGRPGWGVESKYLLTGLGTCACCGRNITMLGGRVGSPGKRKAILYYGCSYHATRGRTVCANDYRARMDEADALVLDSIRNRVLTPAAIDWTIDEAMRQLAELRRAGAEKPERLEVELRKERRQLENLLRALEEGGKGGPPVAVLQRIRALEATIGAKERELAGYQVEEPSEIDLRRLRRAFRERLAMFNELMGSNAQVARQALRKLLAERIRFEPAELNRLRMYHLSWRYSVKSLMDEGYTGVASPRGFEPRFAP